MDDKYHHFHTFPPSAPVDNHIKLSGRVAHAYLQVTQVIMQQLCTTVRSIPGFLFPHRSLLKISTCFCHWCSHLSRAVPALCEAFFLWGVKRARRYGFLVLARLLWSM